MRINQPIESLPQGITTFDTPGIVTAVEEIVSAGLLGGFVAGLLSPTTVLGTIAHVFEPSPGVTKVAALPAAQVSGQLGGIIAGSTAADKVIAALQSLFASLH